SSATACSTLPSVSSSARLQSIIPAPVRSRSSLTAAAVIAIRGAPVSRAPPRGRAVRVVGRSPRDGAALGGTAGTPSEGRSVAAAVGCLAGFGGSGRAREELVVVEVRIERQRAAGGELRHQIGRGRLVELGLLDGWDLGRLGLRCRARRALLAALDRRVGDELAQQAAGAGRVGVGRGGGGEL